MHVLCLDLKLNPSHGALLSHSNLADKYRDCDCCSTAKDTFCISVTIAERSTNSSEELDKTRVLVIPFLLGTVVQGWFCTKNPFHPDLLFVSSDLIPRIELCFLSLDVSSLDIFLFSKNIQKLI